MTLGGSWTFGCDSDGNNPLLIVEEKHMVNNHLEVGDIHEYRNRDAVGLLKIMLGREVLNGE